MKTHRDPIELRFTAILVAFFLLSRTILRQKSLFLILAKAMEPSGIPTKEQEKSMKAMRMCQRMGGWYGLWSTVLAGAVSFAGLTMFCRDRVPKKFIPMITLGCATGTGWMVSIWVTRSCRLEQLKKTHDNNSINEDPIRQEKRPFVQQYPSSDESTENPANKFGDQGFYQEKK